MVLMTKEGINVINFLTHYNWKTVILYSQYWYVRNHVIPNPDFYVLCTKRVCAEAEKGIHMFQNILTLRYDPLFFY